MFNNPKILALITNHKEGRAAAFVWVCSICYCGEQGTNGFIPRVALGKINGRAVDVRLLLQAELWIEEKGSGWWVHDWGKFQVADAEGEARAQRAHKAAMARWHPNSGATS